ncbi:MAG: Pr6Pr family membrane protein [Pseudomonadota bacterium]
MTADIGSRLRSGKREGGALRQALALALAFCAWGALALRTWLSMEGGVSLAEALWTNGRFFTILTNLLVAGSFTLVALGRAPAPRWLTGLMLWIGLVGLVYHAVLAALWEPEGLVLVADILVHTVTPLGTFTYWLFFVGKGVLRWGDLRLWIAWPLIYSIYALGRGAVDGIYPYPFLDVGELGLAGVLMNVAALGAAFALAGALVLALTRRTAR